MSKKLEIKDYRGERPWEKEENFSEKQTRLDRFIVF